MCRVLLVVLALAGALAAGCKNEQLVRDADRESLYQPPRPVSVDLLNENRNWFDIGAGH
jgi:hypothetical protein